jgi:hypothetical protein
MLGDASWVLLRFNYSLLASEDSPDPPIVLRLPLCSDSTFDALQSRALCAPKASCQNIPQNTH